MNKKLIILPLIFMGLTPSLLACTPATTNKFNLTFGTYLTNESVTITYNELNKKMLDEESMIVVTYEGDDSTCGCWRGFNYAINALVKKEHYLIYKIRYDQFGDKENYDFAMADDRPGINFVHQGKLVDSVLYSTKNLDPLFKSDAALGQAIEKRCNKPNYYFLDPNEVTPKTNDKGKEECIITYYTSSCGDCKYVFPNVLYSYTQNKDFRIPMYLVNLEEIKKNNKDEYDTYKKEHFLTNELIPDYGYNQGYVPTFQYYKNGKLNDASVFFNDSIDLVNNEYIVKDSFYTKERKSHLGYLDGVETTVLKGIKLDKNDVDAYQIDETNTIYIWKQEKAAKYHQPLLESFLNKYAL